MRHTVVTRIAWWIIGIAWVVSLASSWVYVSAAWYGGVHSAPPLAAFMRGPVVVSLEATVTLTLVAWQLMTPVSTVARVMFEAGQRAGCPAHGDEDGARRAPGGVVVPMPRGARDRATTS